MITYGVISNDQKEVIILCSRKIRNCFNDLEGLGHIEIRDISSRFKGEKAVEVFLGDVFCATLIRDNMGVYKCYKSSSGTEMFSLKKLEEAINFMISQLSVVGFEYLIHKILIDFNPKSEKIVVKKSETVKGEYNIGIWKR